MQSMQKEDTIQAILIADTFEKHFQPFCNDENVVSVYSFTSIGL